MAFPEACRVQYHVYFTSEELDATYVLTSPRLKGNLTEEAIEVYMEQKTGDVIKYLNEASGVDDFRMMTGDEVECFVRGMHKHNYTDPGEYNADTGFRH